jgi:hypothetical protein
MRMRAIQNPHSYQFSLCLSDLFIVLGTNIGKTDAKSSAVE